MIYSIWMNGNQVVPAYEVSGSGGENAEELGANVFDSIKDYGGKVCIVELHPGRLQPPLRPSDYQRAVIKTETLDYTKVLDRLSKKDEITGKYTALRLLHGIIGLITEAGELADIFKRHIFYGEPLKVEGKGGLIEEAGDESWYLALLADVITDLTGGIGLETIFKRNIDKLAVRYKKAQFTEESAMNRDIDAEEKALRGDENTEK